jgi:phosphoglucomutase
MFMEYRKKFQRWINFAGMDLDLARELTLIAPDEEEISRRFTEDISFGTGGIRGPMGAGTALINIYTVRRASAGLASYLLNNCRQSEGRVSVVIAYDTRHNSYRFTQETAAVLTACGIKAWIFTEPVPTPLLSFAVRELHASAGVVITASHNPPTDNGFKVYEPDGGQITLETAGAITSEIIQVEDELAITAGNLATAEKDGLLEWVGAEVFSSYYKLLQEMALTADWWSGGPLPVSVVYTPLHGTGAVAVPRALNNAGVEDVFLVDEQMKMDPLCSTINCPNPEDWGVYKLAIELGLKEQADLLMATDLDCDRLGVAVRNHSGQYVPLNGNQLGCLMLDYILSRKKAQRKLSSSGIVIQTVVTTAMGKVIAEAYGVETVETLTGFKYIGEVIKERVDTNQNVFLFGFEESYGYLAGDFVRDKDAIQAAQVVVELTAYYKKRRMNLLDALEQLYGVHGYYLEDLINLNMNVDEFYLVEQIMAILRGADWSGQGGLKVIRVDDYLRQSSTDMRTGEQISTGLPASNALKYFLEGDCWFCVRPSGTEPKIKIYFGVKGDTATQAATLLGVLKERVLPLVRSNKKISLE